MEARPILKGSEKLSIFLDSKSMEELLSISDPRAKRLLAYYDSKPFEFIRTPLDSKHEIMNKIISYKMKYLGKELIGIDISREKSREGISVLSSKQNMDSLGQTLFKKMSFTDDEREIVELVFIQASFNKIKGLGLFVTENEFFLKRRYWFEKHSPGCQLNIVNVEEAIDLMNLFAKHKAVYYLAPHYTANKGLWYWFSFRIQIPHYHVGEPILDAFASRFIFALMSIDEMGFRYYSDATNDAMDETLYHFNYFVSLLSGIFDSLAIQTHSQYKLVFKGMEIPSRISINKKAGRDFMQALEDRNYALYEHIAGCGQFIKLIYQLRELVLHREGLQTMGYTSYKEKLHYVEISKKIKEIIDRLGDKKNENEPISKWGICEKEGFLFLDPYNFSKTAMENMIPFARDYLKILGFSNFFHELRGKDKKDDFIETADIFENHALIN